MIYCVIAIIIVLFALVYTVIYLNTKNKELKHKYDLKVEQYNGLYNEFEKYRKSQQFKQEQEEKANEKISDLHSGKLSADDILPKRKKS